MLRDFEGLSGHLHDYKVDIAKSMLRDVRALGARVLLVCSSTSTHATADLDALARDLRKLAMLAVPLRHPHRLRGPVVGPARSTNSRRPGTSSPRRRANLGLGIDSFHVLATGTSTERLDEIVVGKIFLVQLADFMWQEIRSVEERIDTARHFRVFPGEGVHSAQLVDAGAHPRRLGYRGDYSFEVFNDDYVQMPLPVVAERARRSVKWLTDQVSRRSLPLRGAVR